MRKNLVCIIIATAVAVLFSCSKEEPAEPAEDMLVVDGWIESGNSPMVFLTTSVATTSDPKSAAELIDHLVRYAKVTIEHDGVVYPLTSNISEDYYIKTYFTTTDLVGEVGESYTLKIVWNGKTAVSTTTIPEPATLDSIVVTPLKDLRNRMVMAYFTDNPTEKSYYRFFTRIDNLESYFVPSSLGVVEGQESSSTIRVEMTPGHHLPNFFSDGYIYPGDILSIKFATMTREIFNFWIKYDQNSYIAYFPLNISGTNEKGNVEGALGCWAGYGINTYCVCVN